MTAPAALPCALCGLPVMEIGAIRWDRLPERPDYVTGLHVVCKECLGNLQDKTLFEANPPEVAH